MGETTTRLREVRLRSLSGVKSSGVEEDTKGQAFEVERRIVLKSDAGGRGARAA